MKKFLAGGGIVILFGWAMMEVIKPGWTMNVLLGLDILANTIIWGDVETISARAGKAAGNGLADALCFFLDLVDTNHCADAASSGG